MSRSIFSSASLVWAPVRLKKTRGYPPERRAAHLERIDGVGEGRRVRVAGYRGDLPFLLGEAGIEGGPEVLGCDLGERRRAEGRVPFLQQRVRVAGHSISST